MNNNNNISVTEVNKIKNTINETLKISFEVKIFITFFLHVLQNSSENGSKD
jgi:hypothetical protein